MPAGTIDLDAYFARIGYDGGREATLATLRALQRLHTAAIAFENLDPFMGRPVPLDLDALMDKLVRRGRGGYCQEQNHLFRAVLEALGFHVTGLAARVIWGRPDGSPGGRTHMLLLIDLAEGRHMVDVGFGGTTLTGPVRLDSEAPQETPHERFRLVRLDDGFRLEAEVAGAWQQIYRFDLRPQLPIDYEIANFYVSTAPTSPFVTGLMAARTASDRRLALSGARFAVHHLGGPTERRTLENAAALRRVLEEEFLIALPDDPALDQALARVVS
jgi:N-hydroxyarylamine O-acetyltransferase